VTSAPVQACAVGAQLGEAPVWVPHEAALWFVDIVSKRVHRYQPHHRRHDAWDAPGTISFILPTRRGDFIVGLKSSLQRFDPAGAGFQHFADIEMHLSENRLNDACVGPDGSLWVGSMHDLQTDKSGALYRVCAEGLKRMLDDGYVVTNGPAFSPDGCTFYHTDTLRRTIYAFDCDRFGSLSGKRVLTQLEVGDGYPDGTTVDSEGCLWVALWEGWAVRRYSPAGHLLESVQLPCAKVTKVAFAGVDRRTVYVTTARIGLSEAERRTQPLAGDLFSFRSSVPGLAPAMLNI
jgi:xylono-1,5-lactonase